LDAGKQLANQFKNFLNGQQIIFQIFLNIVFSFSGTPAKQPQCKH
jgi:hypothetical protein|tara:strand:+ start:236 stop:370 length:135 start_codon:yes stop_codon:yes gene_type:complete